VGVGFFLVLDPTRTVQARFPGVIRVTRSLAFWFVSRGAAVSPESERRVWPRGRRVDGARRIRRVNLSVRRRQRKTASSKASPAIVDGLLELGSSAGLPAQVSRLNSTRCNCNWDAPNYKPKGARDFQTAAVGRAPWTRRRVSEGLANRYFPSRLWIRRWEPHERTTSRERNKSFGIFELHVSAVNCVTWSAVSAVVEPLANDI